MNRGWALVGALLAALAVAAVLAPLIAPYDPAQTDILNAGVAPSAAHLLGTDELGRDVFSRLLYGARLSLLGPALVIVLATIGGIALGMAGAWVGGWFDTALTRVLDFVFAFPGLLLAVLASVSYAPFLARIVRTLVTRERRLPYVESLRTLGFGGWAICVRHLVPAVWPVVRAQAAVAYGSALVDLSAISYLGLGVRPPSAEWGLMVAQGQPALLNGAPWEALFAGLVIVLVVVGVNTLGERRA
jgi:peptide/nickel transport system permease protein